MPTTPTTAPTPEELAAKATELVMFEGDLDRRLCTEWVAAAIRQHSAPLEAQIAELTAERDKLREALKPFGVGGPAELLAEGVSVMRERIVDWFGPSDFRKAREVLQPKEAGNDR